MKRFTKLFSLLALGLMSAGSAWADNISVPTTAGQYFVLATKAKDATEKTQNTAVTCNGGCSVDNKYGAVTDSEGNTTYYGIGSTKTNRSISFAITATAGDFVFQFLSGADGCSGTVKLELKKDGATENTWAKEDIAIENDGNWTPTKAHRFFIPSIEAGNYTMTLTVTAQTGSYAGNYGYFGMYKASGVNVLVPTSSDIKVGTLTGTDTPNKPTQTPAAYMTLYKNCGIDGSVDTKGAVKTSTTIGSTKNEGKWSFAVYNDKNSILGFTFKSGSRDNAATADIVLTDLDGNDVWSKTGENITKTGAWTLTEEHSLNLGYIPAGFYTLTMTLASTSTGYLGNYGNFQFTQTPAKQLTSSADLQGYKTFYDADNAYSIDSNTKIYVVDSKNSSTVTVKSVENTIIPAATPVFIKTTASDYKMTLTQSNEAGTEITSGLSVHSSSEDAPENAYVLGYLDPVKYPNVANGFGFYPYTVSLLKEGQVYLTIYTSGGGDAEAEAKLSIVEFTPSAINNVNASTSSAQAKAEGKFMKNGQLVIVKNGKQYNAAGQQIK